MIRAKEKIQGRAEWRRQAVLAGVGQMAVFNRVDA